MPVGRLRPIHVSTIHIHHTATQVYVSTNQRAAAVEHEARSAAAAAELEQGREPAASAKLIFRMEGAQQASVESSTACRLHDGTQPPAMVALSRGRSAPGSNGSHWRFVERSGSGHSRDGNRQAQALGPWAP